MTGSVTLRPTSSDRPHPSCAAGSVRNYFRYGVTSNGASPYDSAEVSRARARWAGWLGVQDSLSHTIALTVADGDAPAGDLVDLWRRVDARRQLRYGQLRALTEASA